MNAETRTAAQIAETLTGAMRYAITEGSAGYVLPGTSPATMRGLLRRDLVGLAPSGAVSKCLSVEGDKVRAILCDDANADHAEALTMNRHHDENAASQARIDALHIPFNPAGGARAAATPVIPMTAGQLDQAHAEALSENALRDEFGPSVATRPAAVDSIDLVDIARSIVMGNPLSALELIWSIADEATRARLLASAERLANGLNTKMAPAAEPVTTEVDGVLHALYIELPDQPARPVLVGEVVTDTAGDEFKVEGASRMGGYPATMHGRWQRIGGEVIDRPALSDLSVADGSDLFPNLAFVSENA